MLCGIRHRLTPVVMMLSALSLACSDATGPEERPADALNILRLGPDAPALVANEVSFYAKRGEDREGALFFQASGGGPGDEFVRLRVPSGALLARPDGSPILAGDSVLITLRTVDASRILFEFEPAGLQFSPTDPAELKIEYEHADEDFDSDGDVDEEDADVEVRLAIWRQEAPGDPFVRLGSALIEDLDEVEAELIGFSRYAISY